MRKRTVFLAFFLICICGSYLCYLQFGRSSRILSSYKLGSGGYQSIILDVNANKLYLTNQEAEDILYKTCFLYGRSAKCREITVYLYKNNYSFLHDKVHCMAVYRSSDLMLYNTKEDPERFYLEIRPAPW